MGYRKYSSIWDPGAIGDNCSNEDDGHHFRVVYSYKVGRNGM